MRDGRASTTSRTLLGRLRNSPADQAAWQEFVARYGPKVHRWCRCWRLQEADAQDVTQTVLVKLAVRMRTFEYDPTRSFRAWLKAVARSALRDFLAERRRGPGRPLPSLEAVGARESLVEELHEAFDQELLEEAMARVQLRVAPHRWEAFRLTALEGLSGSAAAAQLGMKVATVFTTRSKIQRLLHEELQRLDGTRGD
jgi:RNA polymerase sigma-70 factor (ECF subfamily)